MPLVDMAALLVFPVYDACSPWECVTTDCHTAELRRTQLSPPAPRQTGIHRPMSAKNNADSLGLEFSLQRPDPEDVERLPLSRDSDGNVVYPEVDVDGDHVHFEMVPMGGDSLLWLTIRRGTTPELASASLRKIAGLLDRYGESLLSLLQDQEGSFSSDGEVLEGPLRLQYDDNGDLVIPHGLIPSTQNE